MTDTSKHDEHIMVDLSQPRTLQEYLRLVFSGFAMGASDIVPGVSGGTMAFILGIYETLINGIKSFNFEAIRKALRLFSSDEDRVTPMQLIDHLHLRFLIPLGIGLLLAIIALSSLLEGWLEEYPAYVFAFFGGLIIASVVALLSKVNWNIKAGISLAIGTVVAYLVTNPALGTLGDAFGHGGFVLFVSGAIAICAMILPGVSGSFLLVVLGQYDFILGAVKDRDILSLIFVAAGAAFGILLFSRLLSWLLKHYENTTIALLIGFMIGSMRLIIYRATHSVPEEGAAVALSFTTEQVMMAFGLALVGFAIVTAIDHMQHRANPILRLIDRNPSQSVASGD